MASLCIQHEVGYRDERLLIDFERRMVFIDSVKISLTRKEFDLLSALAAEAGQTLSHITLLERVWGYKVGTRTRTLDVHLCRVRKKLACTGRNYIETIFGVGARFRPWDRNEARRIDYRTSDAAKRAPEFTTYSQPVYK